MLFVITLGTIVAPLFVGLIQWVFTNYPTIISIPTLNYTIKTDCISLGVWIILGEILGIFFTYLIDKQIRINRTKKQIPILYEIVTKHISDVYSDKVSSENYRDIIKSHLEYVAETLNGNLVQNFNPNDHYLKELYDENVKLVIALTAENPNLWLDPTMYFYLINCCVVSLLKNENNNGTKLKMKDFVNSFGYQEEIIRQKKTLEKFTKLKWDWTTDLNNFDFFRFFLYDGKQKECLETTVFPSLKASHDLFNIKSYFNQRGDIENRLKERNQLGDFYAHIDFLWNEIGKQKFSKSFREVIDKRKKEHLPEFLFLFKETDEDRSIHTVTVHTYVDGNPYFVEYKESPTSNNGYQKVQSLVSYIAQSVYDTTEQYIPAEKYLNTKKSYIKWE
ncbi:hypothetical protein FACS189432_08250 [Bacteroidia bacterium]|nr:hypothetical protein FACS189432_08250 [Bacteroidia bacterium]